MRRKSKTPECPQPVAPAQEATPRPQPSRPDQREDDSDEEDEPWEQARCEPLSREEVHAELQIDPEYEALMDYEFRATNGYLTEEDTGGHCDDEDQETDDPCRVVDLTVLRILREGYDELGPSLTCFVLGKRAFVAYLAAADETGVVDLGCFLGVQVTKDANIDWDFVGGRCGDERVVDFRRRASSSRVSAPP
jgi:hypothetical protein